MGTLTMHRTLTDAGVPPGHADAMLKVIQGGVVTKQDLEIAVTKLDHRISSVETGLAGRIERLENKVNLLFGVGLLAVLAPAVTRLIVGP